MWYLYLSFALGSDKAADASNALQQQINNVSISKIGTEKLYLELFKKEKYSFGKVV